MLAAALVCALAVAPARAADAPKTLGQLVQRALKEGKDAPLNAETARALGISDKAMPARRLRVPGAASPDRQEHAFTVLYSGDPKEPQPEAMLFTVASVREEGGKTVAEAFYQLADAAGKLHAVVRAAAAPGETAEGARVELDPEAKRRFQGEIAFHLRVVPGLKLRYAP